MNLTQMLLQSVLQSQWQVSQLPKDSGGNVQDGSSFQQLLEQRREEASRTQSGEQAEIDRPQSSQSGQESDNSDDPTTSADGAAQAQAIVAGPVVLAGVMLQEAQKPSATAQTGVAQLQEKCTVAFAQGSGEGQAIQSQLPSSLTAGQMDGEPQVQPQAERTEVAQTSYQEVYVGKAAGTQAQGEGEKDALSAPRNLRQPSARQEQSGEMTGVSVESLSTPLFREVEAAPVRVGDTPVDMTAPDQEVQKALHSALKGAAEQGEQRLEIRLSPANLGTVVAEFTKTQDGVLHVVLHAETEQTAKLLSDHAPALTLMLQDSGRGEVRVEVPQPQQNQSPWQQPDQDGGRQQQGQQQQHQQEPPRQETESFLQQLRLGLVGMEREAV